MVIFPLIVTDGGWKDRRKLVFNIDAELGRHLSLILQRAIRSAPQQLRFPAEG